MKIIVKIVIVIVLFQCKIYSQLQYKTHQLFISPTASFGLPMIINQNNYGFGEMAYMVKVGGQYGIQVGYDNYLKSSYKIGLLYCQFGQSYSDILLQEPHEKKVSLNYFCVPFTYKYVFGDTKGFDYEKIYKYVFTGLQIGYLYNAKVDWIRSGSNVGFWDFISYQNVNQNISEIQEIGIPQNDKDFYSKFDIFLLGGFGFQYFINTNFAIFTEGVVNLGLRDINDPQWRFRNKKNKYSSSNNFYGGLTLGFTYYTY